MFRVHGSFVVFMAVQASEHAVIGRIGMAIGAGVPFPFVRTAVNGKELAVVIELRTLPGGDAVAGLTVFGEPGTGVIRAGRGVVIVQVARNAFFGQTRVGSTGMTAIAIQLMPPLQREKSMFETLVGAVPLSAHHVVAAVAVGSETGCAVVGSRRRFVLVPVAAVAIGTHHIVALSGARNVASTAFCLRMRTNQGKSHLAMHLLDLAIVDQPGCRGMAAGTIVSHRLLVYIMVAFGTFRGRIVESQGRMTLFACHRFVLTHQRKPCLVVVEILGFHVVPGRSRVAITAFQLEIRTMRRLHG